MDMKLEAENGGTVKVTLEADEELPVYAAAIYPGQGGMKDIYSVSLCVDDRICSEEYIVGEEAVSPLLLSFEPVQAQKSICVYDEGRHGQSEAFGNHNIAACRVTE